MHFKRIFIVDDDPIIRRMLSTHLQQNSVSVLGLATVQQALEEQKKEPAELLIVDLQLPGSSGLVLLEELRKNSQNPPEVIIMTGFGTIESAVEAMKLGAANYLLKPFTISQFDLALAQLAKQISLRNENNYLREQLQIENFSGEILRGSPEIDRVYKLIEKVAPTNATVLIQGESGTGKELAARTLHEQSMRKERPYIKVNCAAIPENLLESEFFGHEKGAFTGATTQREGRFELAHTGTLLLDEVTEISLGLQAKLLRVLQEQEFERVGGSQTKRVDVRIIATTNRDLKEAVKAGTFRQDLYFRLNVVPLKIPPLRERPQEILFLFENFLNRFAKKHNKPVPKISASASQQMMGYGWPGNVRELQNYAERVIILADDNQTLEFADIVPGASSSSDAALDVPEGGFPTVADMEKRLIEMAMKKSDGNRQEAANLLGINVRTLRNKLNEYAGKKPGEDEEASAEKDLSI